ncbi:MAG: hypothetical protein Q8P42_15115 [Gallionella sp.]|nr:hypothetical protein [Gallionella sp.]
MTVMYDDHNPYSIVGEQPKLRASVVAFVDILGYKALISESHQNGSAPSLLIRLHEALSAASRRLNNLDEDGNSFLPPNLWYKKDLYKIRTFTDNIVIGYPILDDAEIEMGAVFSHLSLFQLEMVNRGFFVRGAIAIGNVYIDDMIVFGQGFLDAYDGESKHARDPRIILAKSAQEAVKQHVNCYSNPSHSPQTRDLYKDSDGQFFLNYLESILIAEEEYGPYFDILAKHKSVVEAKLIEYRDKPAYWAKYAWSASYHNFFCDQYRYFSVEHKIDVSQFKMQPTRIV